MVTKENKQLYRINRLKNIEDNLKFGLITRLVIYLGLVIFLLALLMTMITYYKTLLLKIVAFVFGLLFYLFLTIYFYKNEFKPREDKLRSIGVKIEEIYDDLLN